MSAMHTVLQMPAPAKKAKKDRRGPRGMGSISLSKYGRKDGSVGQGKFYLIRYTTKEIDPTTGKRKRICENTFCTTKEGARQILTERLGKINAGTFTEFQAYQRTTLKQITDAMRAEYVTQNRKSGAKLNHSLELLEKYFGADCLVVDLTSERIEGYRNARRTEGAADPTINRELAALKAALRLGYKSDVVKKVPHITIPDESGNAREGEFTAEQIAALLAALPANVAALVRFVASTGMRISEPLSLKWQHVDLETESVRIPGRLTKNKQQKVLFLAGPAMEALRAQHAVRNGDFVFHSEGQPLSYYMADTPFAAACAALGIPEGQFTQGDGTNRLPGFHDLRRTFARRARAAGIADNMIMEIAGWKTHAMLLRYLGQPKAAAQREAFAKMA